MSRPTTAGFDGHFFNFPEESATYWLARLHLPEGAALRLRGRYARARYQSLNAYSDGSPTDALADVETKPRRGSVNPFVAGNRRDLSDRATTASASSTSSRRATRARALETPSTPSRLPASRSSCSTARTSPTAAST